MNNKQKWCCDALILPVLIHSVISTRIPNLPESTLHRAMSQRRLPTRRACWPTFRPKCRKKIKNAVKQRKPSGRGAQSSASCQRGGHGARGLPAPRSSDRYNNGNHDHIILVLLLTTSTIARVSTVFDDGFRGHGHGKTAIMDQISRTLRNLVAVADTDLLVLR